MATLQARFILLAFVLIAAAITYNAIFLQNGSHPAPMTADANVRSGQSVRTTQSMPKPARTLPRHTQRTQPSMAQSDTVLALQRHLTDRGYEPGPADGVLGDQTRAAIMAYQHDNKLPITGESTGKLLKSMILGSSPGESVTVASSSELSAESAALVKSIQKTLGNLGYDAGPVDGLIGASTNTAIRKFEKDRKLSVKGRISGRLVRELREASGGSLSVIASN